MVTPNDLVRQVVWIDSNRRRPMPVMRKVRIEMPKTMFDGGARVLADLGHGEEKIFEFYPDEISFSAEELEGKTVDEALSLKREKDIAYLKHP